MYEHTTLFLNHHTAYQQGYLTLLSDTEKGTKLQTISENQIFCTSIYSSITQYIDHTFFQVTNHGTLCSTVNKTLLRIIYTTDNLYILKFPFREGACSNLNYYNKPTD